MKHVKKLLCLMLVVIALAAQASAIDLYVDGRHLDSDVAPLIVDGRTLVPVRVIFEALGANVEWDNTTKTATATKDGIAVKITVNSKTAYINNEAKSLDVPAQIVGGRTLVPARFVSEALNAGVRWENETKTVYIATKPEYDGYTIAPESIFNTTAAENGLNEVFMYIDGTVKQVTNIHWTEAETNSARTDPFCILSTNNGEIGLINIYKPYDFNSFSVGQSVRLCFFYADYSEELNMPLGFYMETGELGENESSSDSPVEQTPQSKTVYVTKTGKRYHYDSSCNGGTYYKSTLEDALWRGLKPCEKCVH